MSPENFAYCQGKAMAFESEIVYKPCFSSFFFPASLMWTKITNRFSKQSRLKIPIKLKVQFVFLKDPMFTHLRKFHFDIFHNQVSERRKLLGFRKDCSPIIRLRINGGIIQFTQEPCQYFSNVTWQKIKQATWQYHRHLKNLENWQNAWLT